MTHPWGVEEGGGPPAETLLSQHSDLKVVGSPLPAQLLPQMPIPELASSSLPDAKLVQLGHREGEGEIKRASPF